MFMTLKKRSVYEQFPTSQVSPVVVSTSLSAMVVQLKKSCFSGAGWSDGRRRKPLVTDRPLLGLMVKRNQWLYS